MKKIKIPLPSFDRMKTQHESIIRNRYALEISSDPSVAVVHEIMNDLGKWRNGYSWFGLYVNPHLLEEVIKSESSKEYLFGLLKKYEDYYDGPIITWAIGSISLNYRW